MNEINISDLIEGVNKPQDPLTEVEKLKGEFMSANFSEKSNFLDLLNIQSNDSSFNLAKFDENQILKKDSQVSLGYDSVILQNWKNVENISARFIEHYDDIVILECLIDKENDEYEEREFRASLFQGYELKEGNLFYLRFYDRANETKMEIHNDPGLVNIKDFPKMDFKAKLENSKLFKK